MVTTLCVFAYVAAVVLAINKKGNWYKHILVLQGFVSAALVGLFLLKLHSDTTLLFFCFIGLSLSLIAFIPRVRTHIGF